MFKGGEGSKKSGKPLMTVREWYWLGLNNEELPFVFAPTLSVYHPREVGGRKGVRREGVGSFLPHPLRTNSILPSFRRLAENSPPRWKREDLTITWDLTNLKRLTLSVFICMCRIFI